MSVPVCRGVQADLHALAVMLVKDDVIPTCLLTSLPTCLSVPVCGGVQADLHALVMLVTDDVMIHVFVCTCMGKCPG